jgi:L,D-transpeptidase ErfK/SrfK
MSEKRLTKPASARHVVGLGPWRWIRWALALGSLAATRADASSRPACAAPHRIAQIRPLVGQVRRDEALEGDTLLTIAERNHLAIDHLCFANAWPTEATLIYAGTPVIVPSAHVLPANPPRDGIVVNLPERALYLFAGGHFKQFYPVSIGYGKQCPTPLMSTHIIDKVKEPTWYPPARFKGLKPVPPGPDNPLGARWMGLGVGCYGIHSTNNSVNIGLSTTGGCLRLYPHDIIELYDQVQVGLPVRVEYETAKVGRAADGSLHLVTFPDVYHRSAPDAAAQRLLDKLGLASQWSPALARAAASTQGLPIALTVPQPLCPAPQASPRPSKHP